MDIKNLGEKAKTFLADNRHWWVIALVVLVLFCAGYATGRYATPPKVVVTEKVREVEKEKVVTVTKTDVQIVKVRDAQTAERVHRVTTEDKKPGGEVVTTTTEDRNVDSVVHDHDQEVKVQYVDRVVEKVVQRDVEKVVKQIRQPDWSIYAGVGLDIPAFLGQGQHGVPGLQGLVVQAGVDRRILGLFWLGLYGNTEGVLGLNLRVAW